jgi:hypothetical protein
MRKNVRMAPYAALGPVNGGVIAVSVKIFHAPPSLRTV